MKLPVSGIAQLIRPYRGLLAVAFGAMLVEGAADLLDPWPLKVIFDYVIGDKTMPAWLAAWPALTHDRLTLLTVSAVTVIVIAVIGSISAYWSSYLSTTAGQHVMHDLRHMVYHHVQRLSLSFYETRQTGDLIVRLTSDIDAAQDFVSSVLLGIVLDVLTLLGILGVMFFLDWHLTLIALSVTPVLGFVVFRLTSRIKRAAREVKKRESDLASVVQESITSVRVVKAFGSEDYEESRLDRQSLLGVDAALRARSVKARLSPLVDIIVAAGTCLVLLLGARLVIGGELSAGSLIVFLAYLGRLYKPIKDLSKMTDTLSKVAVSFERIGEILRTDSQVVDRPDSRPAPAFSGLIALDRVTFGYDGAQPILNDVSLVIQPGQAAALVGLTGSGKSTLLSLIPRFYDPQAGVIRIDDRPVQEYTLKSLRDQISVVLQESVLFRMTIAQNIAYGSQRATREEVIRAAQTANAHEFITRLPDGYETVVGERGETLSGGQRQRIAIARAIIRDTPILLLDEPSAALDPQSEELIFEAIGRLMHGRTSLTIAHRLATIRRADVIFVLDGGVIVERGTHGELLAAGGEYARLHRIQFQTTDAPQAPGRGDSEGGMLPAQPAAAGV
jgi:ATP-binding cassette subfamily B protein